MPYTGQLKALEKSTVNAGPRGGGSSLHHCVNIFNLYNLVNVFSSVLQNGLSNFGQRRAGSGNTIRQEVLKPLNVPGCLL